MEDIKTEKISLKVSDDSEMDVHAAFPNDNEKHPGILVFQEAFGVNHHIRNIAERFAKLGYVAAAPELYHRTQSGFEGSYDNFDAIREHMQATNTETLTADIKATYEWLNNNSHVKKNNIVSIGFCLGGRVSFIANVAVELKAAVSFYGAGIVETLLDRINEISAPQLMFWGGLDKHITSDKVAKVNEELKKQNKKYVNVVFSQADHGFFNDQRSVYNPEAAGQAWELVKQFLKTYLD
jgi:carboxymethylenebutenolidase